MKYLLFIFYIYVYAEIANSVKILGIFPFPGSHYILAKGLLIPLARAGHNVTVISSEGEKVPPKNCSYRDIVLSGFLKKLHSSVNFLDLENHNAFTNLITINKLLLGLEEEFFSDPAIKKLISSDEKFDLIISAAQMNHGVHALAPHFNSSLILFSSIRMNDYTSDKFGHPLPLSYVPSFLIDLTNQMTFYERVLNVVYWSFNQGIQYFYVYPKVNQIIKKYIPNSVDLYDVLYNASIVLTNSHVSIDYPLPSVPSVIEIGGYWITPPKRLPPDLQIFLDNAKEGAIYFSLGSYLRSSDLPVDKLNAILKVFSKLNQKILWKWEDEQMPNKPSNVKIGKWLPQQDILAHPNVKLFITHGGLLSTTETIYNGKPTLTIPIMSDQKYNAKLCAQQGFSRTLLYKELNENSLEQHLKELLNNPKYFQIAQIKSKLFHDQQTKPLDRAIYWIEYVARHGGAAHLRVAGLNLTWYQYQLLDVIITLIIITLLSFILFAWLAKRLINFVIMMVKGSQIKLKIN